MSVDVKDSNEVEFLAFPLALRIYSFSFHEELIVESDSYGVMVTSSDKGPWNFHYILYKIRSLVSSFQVVFHHVVRSSNDLANYLAKQGVDRVGLCRSFGAVCIPILSY